MAHWVCLHVNRLSLITTLYPRRLVVRAHTRCLCVVMTSAGSPLTQCKLPSPPGTGSPDAGSRAPVTSIIMFIFIYLESLETFSTLHSALLMLSWIIKSRSNHHHYQDWKFLSEMPFLPQVSPDPAWLDRKLRAQPWMSLSGEWII